MTKTPKKTYTFKVVPKKVAPRSIEFVWNLVALSTWGCWVRAIMAVWHTRLRRDRLIWGPNSLAEFARLNYFKSMGLNEKTKFAWADWDFIDNPPTFQEQWVNTTPVLVMVFSVWRAYGDLPFLIGLIDSSVCMLKTFFKDVRSLFVSNVQTPTQVGTQQIEVLIESKGKVAVDTYDNKTCYKYIGAYICIRLVVFVCTGVPFLLF